MVKKGEYLHYKGKHYQVLFLGTHSETGEKLVVYRALNGTGRIWIRPLSIFSGKVLVGGRKIPRFKFLGALD